MSAMSADLPGDMPIDHAIAYAAAGIRVLPIKPGQKRPPMNSWQHAATIDPKTIHNWWNGLYKDNGVGLAMGEQPDGRHLFALDIDEHDPAASGSDTLAELERIHGPLPDTVRSITGSGGAHHIFDAGTVDVTNGAAGAVGPGIDVRGAGGQIVVAPTIHPNGNPYAWDAGCAPWERPIAAAPAWLLDLVTPRAEASAGRDLPAEASAKPTPSQNAGKYDNDNPADTLRAGWDWPTELQRRGWQLARTARDGTHWTRPGKDPREGTSAVLHGPDGPLVVFTTDTSLTAMWRAGKQSNGCVSLSPLAYVAAYDHQGDLSAATRALRAAQGPTDLAGMIAASPTGPAPQSDGDDPDAHLRALLLDWPAFWEKDHSAEEWLAEPIIPAKRSVAMFAPGGTGKSLLSLWLAAGVATGTPILGNATTPRNVLYLDYEMTEDDLHERLEAMGYSDDSDLSRLHYALLPALPGLDEPEGGKAVVRLAQLCDAELVVIDTFGRAVHGDENEADTVRAWYRWTGLHLKHDGRAFLRVDHAGKDVEKGQRGTSAKNDDVDVVWRLTKLDGDVFKLIAKKKRMGWVPESVELHLDEADALRYTLTAGVGYPAGTAELAAVLDELGVAAELSAAKATKVLREAGHGGRNEVIRAAVKYRREAVKSSLPPVAGGHHPAVQAVIDAAPYGPKNAPRETGRGQTSHGSGARPGDPGAIEETPGHDIGRGAGRGGARSTDASGARCAPLRGAHTPSVTPEPSNPRPSQTPERLPLL
jgi:hypothetical protein